MEFKLGQVFVKLEPRMSNRAYVLTSWADTGTAPYAVGVFEWKSPVGGGYISDFINLDVMTLGLISGKEWRAATPEETKAALEDKLNQIAIERKKLQEQSKMILFCGVFEPIEIAALKSKACDIEMPEFDPDHFAYAEYIEAQEIAYWESFDQHEEDRLSRNPDTGHYYEDYPFEAA